MTDTTVGTIETLIDATLGATDDPEQRYRLRTALQLLYVVEQQYDQARETLREADLDEDLRADLRDLGYLD